MHCVLVHSLVHFEIEKWCQHEESNSGATDYKGVNFLSLSVRKCLQEAVLAPWIELEVYLAVSIHTRTSTIQAHFLVHFETLDGRSAWEFPALWDDIKLDEQRSAAEGRRRGER